MQNSNIKRGDIFKCRLGGGAVGSEIWGHRPCVIVSNDRNNRFSSTVTVVPLTSSEFKAELPVHVQVRCLGTQSTAMCEQIRTVSIERLDLERMSAVTPEEMAAIERGIKIQLGLRG